MNQKQKKLGAEKKLAHIVAKNPTLLKGPYKKVLGRSRGIIWASC